MKHPHAEVIPELNLKISAFAALFYNATNQCFSNVCQAKGQSHSEMTTDKQFWNCSFYSK